MSQIVERFESAVQVLVGDGPIKDRLSAAYCNYLEDLQQVELPVRDNGEFSRLHAMLHSADPVGNSDGVQASIRKMSSRDASGHSRTIVRLYGQLLALEQSARPQVEAVPAPATARPPGFLVNRGS